MFVRVVPFLYTTIIESSKMIESSTIIEESSTIVHKTPFADCTTPKGFDYCKE